MNDVLRMGRKAFTVSVVVATIAWSIGLAALLLPLAAGAATLSSGDLIKASLPAVYYYGADGKRYVFPNEKTYMTWYSDFSSVKTITDAELAAIAIGGNATYKPGVKMVKITTDPKVYAVDAGGTLRWINSETVAAALYGGEWAKSVNDIPDAFFVNYKTGGDIATASEFVKATVTAAAQSINVDKGLASASAGTGALSFALASDNPLAQSVVVDATDGGMLRAPFLKFVMSAGTADVNISAINFKRGGISKDGDIGNALLMEGNNILAEANSVGTAGIRFTFAAGELVISANNTRTFTLGLNLDKAMTSGSTMNISLASADVTSDAASVSGSLSGNTMTNAVVTDIGTLAVGTMTYPSSVDPGVTNKEMVRMPLTAGSQDMLLTYLKMTNLGSSYDADIQNIKLMDGATQLNGVVAVVKNKTVEFDLTTMTGGGYKILAGQTKQLTLNGDIIAGTNRTFQWSIQKQYDLRATDMQYNIQAFVNNNTTATWAVVKAAVATDIKTGSLSVSVATDSPSSNIPDAATGVTLAKFNFKASGEDVKITDLTVICTGSTTTRALKNSKVLLDGVQVGSSDTSMICDATTDEYTLSFGNSFIVKAGITSIVSIVADTNASVPAENWAADDTLFVGFGGTGVAQGKSSLISITPTNISGRTLTIKTGTVSVIKNQSFSDRSTSLPTGVANASNIKLGSFVIIGGAGEAVDISQIVLYDDGTYQLAEDFQNLTLKDVDGNQIGTTISTLNSTTASSYTFTPALSIRLAAGAQKAFDVFADILGSPFNSGTAAHAGVCVASISATGVETSASANYGSSACTDALQLAYIAANGQLTITAAADTPVAQQQLLGSTGVELAKFKLAASAEEDINITQFVVQDDMSTAFGAAGSKAATGSIKNLKLYNGSTLLASVAALDPTRNTSTPNAVFTGFALTVPKNQNITLTVKGDLTSYDDGGIQSSSHRIFIPTLYQGQVSTAPSGDPITAIGAGSGFSISSTSLDIGANTDVRVNGNYMDLVRAKLTLAHAADSPSGAASAASEQTVAKFVATNSANIGNYSVTITRLNFAISSTSNSTTNASTLNVYKDSVSTANLLVTTSYGLNQATYVDTVLGNLSTSLEIASGSSKTILVTLETSDGGFTSSDTLSVGMAAANDIIWGDGASTVYQQVDTLPLAGKTLVY
jgi:hypothetical protein